MDKLLPFYKYCLYILSGTATLTVSFCLFIWAVYMGLVFWKYVAGGIGCG